MFKYFLNNNSKMEKHFTFNIPVLKIQATLLNGEEYLFGLSHNHRFMCGSKIISTQTTSFALYDSYFIFTQNTLGMYQCMYFYDLLDSTNPLTSLSDTIVLPSPVIHLISLSLIYTCNTITPSKLSLLTLKTIKYTHFFF